MLHAIKKSDGTVSIMELVGTPILDDDGNDTGEVSFPEVEAEIEKWHADDIELVVSHRPITADQCPADRAFRAAWTDDNPTETIDVHMGRARAIHMARIRIARNDRLKELDIETLRGRDVQADKQVLRNIPQTFDLTTATTPDALKALWPAELSAPSS